MSLGTIATYGFIMAMMVGMAFGLAGIAYHAYLLFDKARSRAAEVENHD